MILCCAVFTNQGKINASRIPALLPDIHVRWREENEPLQDFAAYAFHYHLPLLFVGAVGIAVRAIAPFVRDKLEDSAVLVMDEGARYVIPILSGHMGGANDLAARIANALHARPVFTTASDTRQVFSCDVFARRNHLAIHHREGIRKVTEKLLQEGRITICIQPGIALPGEAGKHLENPSQAPLPDELLRVPYPTALTLSADFGPDILIAAEDTYADRALLFLSPKTLYIGMGCRKGKSFEELYAFERSCLSVLAGTQDHPADTPTGTIASIGRRQNGTDTMDTDLLRSAQVAAIASIDRKGDEPGLEILCQYQHLPYLLFSKEELQAVPGVFADSVFVAQAVGVSNVCERAAMCAAGPGARLLLGKTTGSGMTLAAARGLPSIRTWDTTPGR